MTIRIKILVGCLLLTMLTGSLGMYSQDAERKLGALALDIYDNAFMAANYLRSSEVTFNRLVAESRKPGWSKKDAEETEHDMLTDLDVVRTRAMSPAGRAQAERLQSSLTALLPRLREDPAGAERALDAYEGLVEKFAGDGYLYRQRVGRMVAVQITRSSEVIGASLLAALLITFLINNMISPPVRAAVRIAQSIAGGRLDNEIVPRGRGETADLLRALAAMQTSIAAGINRIKALMDEQKASHAGEIAAQHAQMEAALGSMSQGLCLYNATGHLLVSNRRFAEMFVLPAKGQTCEEVLLASGLEMLVEASSEGAAWAITCELDDGRVVAVEQTRVAGGGWVATYEDVSERRAAEGRLETMVRRDELTGLPNRLAFDESMRPLLAEPRGSEAVAVLCIDLDRFSYINEAFGQDAGNILLCDVALRLSRCIAPDDLLVRLGSDEFAILQRATPPDGVQQRAGASGAFGQPEAAMALAQRVLAALAEPFHIDLTEAAIGCSIGIAVVDGARTRINALFEHAGMALQRAKMEGRGIWRFYEPEMDAHMRARRDMEMDLREAVELQQFAVFYQPQIRGGGGIIGFEALLRWQHPSLGLLAAAEFIPLADEIGLMPRLGGWVLRRACLDAACWPGRLPVSVNLSASQFGASLVDDVSDALAESGLAPALLVLEMSETALLREEDVAADMMQQLHVLGVRLALDNFGAGHSSLHLLGRGPFDSIKIDRHFVQNMMLRADCLTIIRAAIGLGRSLGQSVVAEGVETEEQRDGLIREGCHAFQGYLFGTPEPASQVQETCARFGEAHVAIE